MIQHTLLFDLPDGLVNFAKGLWDLFNALNAAIVGDNLVLN